MLSRLPMSRSAEIGAAIDEQLNHVVAALVSRAHRAPCGRRACPAHSDRRRDPAASSRRRSVAFGDHSYVTPSTQPMPLATISGVTL